MEQKEITIEVQDMDVLGNAAIAETDVEGVFTEAETGRVFIAGKHTCLVVSTR